MKNRFIEELEAEVMAAATPEPTAETDTWFPLIQDAADSMTQVLPPVVEIVKGIVPEQAKLTIGGGSKTFKTWIALYMALAIAHGVDFLGRQTSRRRILYVNLELKPNTLIRRLQAIAGGLGIEVDRGWFYHLSLRGRMSGVPLFEVVSRIIRFAKHHGIAVVVLDPLYKLNTQGDENSSRDQTLCFNELDRITTEAEATLILTDHFSKGNQSEKDPLDAIRGSSVKGGDVDAAMVLRKHEIDGCFRVDLVHRELPPVAPFCIGWTYPLMEPRPDLDPDNMKKARGGRRKAHDPIKLIAPIVGRTIDNPVSISEWATLAGVKRQTLNDYLPEMRTAGWVKTVGEGNTARQYLTTTGLEVARRATGGAE